MKIVNGVIQGGSAGGGTGDFTAGTVTVGDEDIQSGTITAYGHATGSTQGGKVVLETAADHDGTIGSWIMQVTSDNVTLGPDTDPDVFYFLSSGFQFTIAGSVVFSVSGTSGDITMAVGRNDLRKGIINVQGDATGETGGGQLNLLVAADHDGTINSYNIAPFEDDLYIGPSTNADSLKHTGDDGTWHFTAGKLKVGVNDTVVGNLEVFGDNDDNGGILRLYVGGGEDATTDSFGFAVNDDDLYIGPDTDSDSLKFATNDGAWHFTAGLVNLGVDDLVTGRLNLYADDGDSGASFNMFLGKDTATSRGFPSYLFDVEDGGDLTIGPSNDTDAIKYDSTLNKFILTAAGGFEFNHGAILTVDGTYSGETMIVDIDDASSIFGSVLYQAADFHYDRTDADAAATMPGLVMAITAGASATATVLLRGQVCETDWNWSAGLIYPDTTTPGGLTQTPPSGTADVVQIAGWALSADTILFSPQLVTVVVP